MRHMYDNVELPAHPPNVEATAFYIGGKNAYRVWPMSEVAGIRTRWRLPIWVNDHPIDAAEGHKDGADAAHWALVHGQQQGTCIALDYELAVNAGYVRGFDAATTHAGFRTMLYGSESSVLHNPEPSGGYWVAHYDGIQTLKSGWAAKQYANDTMLGHPWDLSVVADSTPLWDTQAKRKERDVPSGQMSTKVGDVTPVAFQRGEYTHLILLADNGKEGKSPVKVRIAENHGNGNWAVIDNVTVDSHKGSTVYALQNTTLAEGISLTREDSGGANCSYTLF